MALEPWGILAAVLALIVAITQFWVEFADRVNEREVRAWQLVTTVAPGNSGKVAALEYLNQEDGFLCFEWLQGHLSWLHAENANTGCLFLLKPQTELVGIDLSVRDNGPSNGQPNRNYGVFLQGVDLSGAVLRNADLSGADLSGRANLSNADLSGAVLSGADLSGADLISADLSGRTSLSGAVLRDAVLWDADLSGAFLSGAVLWDADLSGADLSGADLWDAFLSGAVLWDADLSGADLSNSQNLSQEQLHLACGDEATLLPAGRTIPTCSE